MTNVTVVVGAQFGSEGKGAISAYLTREFNESDVAIRVAGPNAGHTAYDKDGREWKLRCVPVAAVSNSECQLHIAAGSEIDPDVLWAELADLDNAGHKASARLTIHPAATVILRRNLDSEAMLGLTDRIGSTGKGIGSARADRILRIAPTWGDYAEHDNLRESSFNSEPGPFDLGGVGNLLIEGTQGYGLGLHTEFYPHVTSSDCRAIDFLAMAGISPWDEDVDLSVVLVARVYPIRVAGNSGPLADETTWGELGLPEERTTVTNKIRRVGKWDAELVREAIAANGGGSWKSAVSLALTMLDQLYPEVRDRSDLMNGKPLDFVEELASDLETDIAYVGTGPQTVVEL